jgi:hypothetical protein
MPIILKGATSGQVTLDTPVIAGTNNLELPAATGTIQLLKLETSQATTSGTFKDFTGIPSWAKKITIMFNRVSTNGSSNIGIQIGAGSVETTGYISNAGSINNTPGYFSGGTSLLIVWFNTTTPALMTGHVTLTLVSSNLWLHSGVLDNGLNAMEGVAGSKTISGTLDRLRITTVNGTDTFDAGSVNILIEGN